MPKSVSLNTSLPLLTVPPHVHRSPDLSQFLPCQSRVRLESQPPHLPRRVTWECPSSRGKPQKTKAAQLRASHYRVGHHCKPLEDSPGLTQSSTVTLLWPLGSGDFEKSEVAVQFLLNSASWGQPAASWRCREGLRWPEHCAESSCHPISTGHGGSFESFPLHKVMEAIHRCSFCTNRPLFSQTRARLGLGAKSSKWIVILNHYYYLVLFVGSWLC